MPPDTDLTAVAADLDRLDVEISALSAQHPGKDLHGIRGIRTREVCRDKALRTLCRTPARTTAGLEAKARALRTPELIADVVRHSALAESLANDMETMGRLPAAPNVGQRFPTPNRNETPSPLPGDLIDPIFAAIATSRRANESFARAHLHRTASTTAGEARMQRVCAAKDEAWAALLAMRPTTPAGGGALAAHAADWIAVSPDLPSGEIVTLLRAIAAVGPGHACSEATAPAPQVIPGFMEYPKGQRFHWLIEVVLAEEARRWLKIACDEYDRQLAEWGDGSSFPPGVLKQHTLALRQALRLDAWFEAAGEGVTEVSPAPTPIQAAGPAVPDPAFAAMTAHRAAHIAWQAALKVGDDAASDVAMDQKNAAFEALLRTAPTTEAGLAASTRHVLFEFVRITHDGGVVIRDWARDAGRLVNGGLPVLEDSLPPPVIEPDAAQAALQAAIEAHQLAYGHRLYSMVAGEADLDERTEQERQAFRALLHTPLASDAARVAYAKAVLGRACGAYGAECDGADRSSPLPTAYRNLAFGDYAPEPAGDACWPQPSSSALAPGSELRNV